MTHYHHLAYSRSWLDEELHAAVQLLKVLTETTPCRLDEDGFCLAHEATSPCPHGAAQDLFARHP